MPEVSAIYTDLDLSFIPHPITNNPRVLTNERAVAQALKRIVSTNYGEIPFEYFKGADVRSLLFENADGYSTFLLKDKIQRAIDKYEERVKILAIDVTYENSNDCFITIEFEVISINRFGSVSFNLNRIR